MAIKTCDLKGEQYDNRAKLEGNLFKQKTKDMRAKTQKAVTMENEVGKGEKKNGSMVKEEKNNKKSCSPPTLFFF